MILEAVSILSKLAHQVRDKDTGIFIMWEFNVMNARVVLKGRTERGKGVAKGVRHPAICKWSVN